LILATTKKAAGRAGKKLQIAAGLRTVGKKACKSDGLWLVKNIAIFWRPKLRRGGRKKA
jgi:hypothetical protein